MTMKTHNHTLTVLLFFCFVFIPPATAQQEQSVSPEVLAALQELQARGLVNGYNIEGEEFFDELVAGNVDAVRLFLTVGVSPDVRDMRDLRKRNALLIAAEAGHAEVVEALVEAGADVGVKDWVGRTPLVVAAAYEHDDVVDVLLRQR